MVRALVAIFGLTRPENGGNFKVPTQPTLGKSACSQQIDLRARRVGSVHPEKEGPSGC